MAINRRSFIASLAALGLGGFMPASARGDGGRGYLSTGFDTLSKHHMVSRLGADFDLRWDLPLPARGHAATVRPGSDEGLVVARRPGSFAIVFDLNDGRQLRRIDPVPGRHFYGHGIYSADGRTLWMTENAYQSGDGMIGVYDAANGYAPVAAFPSGGIGPHQLAMMSDGKTLAIANGGIRTHPDSGRRKLNLATMQPSLSYIDTASGRILEQVTLTDPALHQLSIRHLAILPGGGVAFACQDQGEEAAAAPLVYTHRIGSGQPFSPLAMPETVIERLHGYCGSVTYDHVGQVLAVSSPVGGIVAFWQMPEGRWLGRYVLKDGCGVAESVDPAGFALSSGEGLLVETATGRRALHQQRHAFRQWDNHLTAI